MAESRLTKLPAELRNQVYRYVVVSEEAINITRPPIRAHTALLQVCKQMRTEATKMFYSENTFRVPEGHVKSVDLTSWITSVVGKDNATFISSLKIALPAFDVIKPDLLSEAVEEIATAAASLGAAALKVGVPYGSIALEREHVGTKKDLALADSAYSYLEARFKRRLIFAKLTLPG